MAMNQSSVGSKWRKRMRTLAWLAARELMSTLRRPKKPSALELSEAGGVARPGETRR
jgi:hypothetical protein